MAAKVTSSSKADDIAYVINEACIPICMCKHR